MIKIKVTKKDSKISEIIIKGHSNYDDYGKDIICASVSSITTTTVNAVLKIDKKAIYYDENVFIIKVLKDDDIVNKLLINMLELLKELENDYPRNVKFL